MANRPQKRRGGRGGPNGKRPLSKTLQEVLIVDNFYETITEAPDVVAFLKSFPQAGAAALSSGKLTTEQEQGLQELSRRVFAILFRLATEAPRAEWLKSSGIFSPPALLDLCAVYGRENGALLGRLVDAVMAALGDHVAKEMRIALPAIISTLKAATSQAEQGTDTPATMRLGDAIGAVATLLSSSEQAARRLGPVFQPANGDVSADGFVAALAAAAHAVAAGSRGAAAASGLQDESMNNSKSRQYVVRCAARALEALLCGVFGQPREQAPHSVRAAHNGGSAAAGDFRTEAWFAFLANVAALNPNEENPDAAGAFLGECSRRFHLPMRIAGYVTSGQLEEAQGDYLLGLLKALPQLLADKGPLRSAEGLRRLGRALGRAAGNSSASADGRAFAGQAAAAAAAPLSAKQITPEEAEKKIQEVQEIFGGPDAEGGVGEGFVGACLASMDWSVDAVVGALLEGNLPLHLAKIDRKLRGGWQGKRGDHDGGYAPAAAAERERQRERLLAMEREAEADAYAQAMLGQSDGYPDETVGFKDKSEPDEYAQRFAREYSDDYDDAFDHFEGGVGPEGPGLEATEQLDGSEAFGGTIFASGPKPKAGRGGGSFLMDQDTARRYNRAARQEEEEQAFWAANRNTNRASAAAAAAAANDGESSDEGEDDEGAATAIASGGGNGGGGGGGSGNSKRATGGTQSGSSVGGRGGRGSRGGRGGDSEAVGTSAGSEGAAGQASGEMSKLDKRRKDANKAKVANHHRKDRAARKTAGGINFG